VKFLGVALVTITAALYVLLAVALRRAFRL
jgi:hypothetical protein